MPPKSSPGTLPPPSVTATLPPVSAPVIPPPSSLLATIPVPKKEEYSGDELEEEEDDTDEASDLEEEVEEEVEGEEEEPSEPSPTGDVSPTHDNTFPCPICGKKCRTNAGLQSHMRAKHPDTEQTGRGIVFYPASSRR